MRFAKVIPLGLALSLLATGTQFIASAQTPDGRHAARQQSVAIAAPTFRVGRQDGQTSKSGATLKKSSIDESGSSQHGSRGSIVWKGGRDNVGSKNGKTSG